MQGIGKFFDKFRNSAMEQVRVRMVICDVMKKIVKQDVVMEDISIRNGVIRIKGSQGMKNEIFIKKNDLLKALASQISTTKFSDIQ